jgi:acyl phosphate:glycerol-3-phosphate acyltransferase
VISSIAAVIISYLIGSFPSAYLVGRWWGKIDLRQEGDGHISATAVHRYLGRKAIVLVMVLDIGKGILSVYIASLLTGSVNILVLAGLTTFIGHCWSVFLGFKGGLGGLVMFGVLASLSLKEVGIGVAAFLLVMIITRKTSLGTVVFLLTVSIALFVDRSELIRAFLPLAILGLHYLKRYQVRQINPTYKNEAWQDLKRPTKE